MASFRMRFVGKSLQRGVSLLYTGGMERLTKVRANYRVTPACKDLLEQIATALGLSVSNALEVLVREKGIALGMRPRQRGQGSYATPSPV